MRVRMEGSERRGACARVHDLNPAHLVPSVLKATSLVGRVGIAIVVSG